MSQGDPRLPSPNSQECSRKRAKNGTTDVGEGEKCHKLERNEGDRPAVNEEVIQNHESKRPTGGSPSSIRQSDLRRAQPPGYGVSSPDLVTRQSFP